MEKFKKAQVVMLPTNSSNIALITSKTEFMIGTETSKSFLQGGKEWVYNRSITDNSTMPQHLYIISDDEIKEGDWILHKNNYNIYSNPCQVISTTLKNNKPLFIETDSLFGNKGENNKAGCYKIIATTGKLSIDNTPKNAVGAIIGIEEMLPQPSQQFIENYIESYNKGLILSDVLVEYEQIPRVSIFSEYEPGIQTSYGYKLKINPKDNTIIIKPLRESWSREDVLGILIRCCGEVSCEDGILLGKEPHELYEWISENL